MSHSSGDKRHLMPLLEFLRFVSARGTGGNARFPKKINGGVELGGEVFDSYSEQYTLSPSPDYMFDSAASGSWQESPNSSQDSSSGIASERRKRFRSPDLPSTGDGDVIDAPVECEVVSSTPDKGCFTSKYVDLSLRDLGVLNLVDLERQPFTKEVAKQIQGLQCCYLRLGTSMIVTGDIVDVSVSEEEVLVSPDRGQRVGLEWVPLGRLFQIPHNLGSVRAEAAQRIKRIIEAEKSGKKTPELSPLQLAQNPATALFPESPAKSA